MVRVVRAEPVEMAEVAVRVDAARGVFTQPSREVLTMKVYRPPVPMRGVRPVTRGRLVVRVDRGRM